MTSNTLIALLYEHEDGRYAVNPDAAGDPGWHRLGPVDVSALAAQAGAPAAPAALICAAHAVVDADDAQGKPDIEDADCYTAETVRGLLAAAPLAPAVPAYAEMLDALQAVAMDVVGIGDGESAISDAARAKVEAVLEKIGAPWPSPTAAPAAPAVDADPLGLRDVGEALMATIECNADALKAAGWTAPMDCPSEIVVDLLNLLDDAKAASAVNAQDAARLRWLTDDHASVYVRVVRNAICERLPVMSYSAACTDIDAAIAAQTGAPRGDAGGAAQAAAKEGGEA